MKSAQKNEDFPSGEFDFDYADYRFHISYNDDGDGVLRYKIDSRDQEILRELKHRRDIVKDEELVNDYLEYCRSTNLRDFNDLLMGKCGVEFN